MQVRLAWRNAISTLCPHQYEPACRFGRLAPFENARNSTNCASALLSVSFVDVLCRKRQTLTEVGSFIKKSYTPQIREASAKIGRVGSPAERDDRAGSDDKQNSETCANKLHLSAVKSSLPATVGYLQARHPSCHQTLQSTETIHNSIHYHITLSSF